MINTITMKKITLLGTYTKLLKEELTFKKYKKLIALYIVNFIIDLVETYSGIWFIEQMLNYESKWKHREGLLMIIFGAISSLLIFQYLYLYKNYNIELEYFSQQMSKKIELYYLSRWIECDVLWLQEKKINRKMSIFSCKFRDSFFNIFFVFLGLIGNLSSILLILFKLTFSGGFFLTFEIIGSFYFFFRYWFYPNINLFKLKNSVIIGRLDKIKINKERNYQLSIKNLLSNDRASNQIYNKLDLAINKEISYKNNLVINSSNFYSKLETFPLVLISVIILQAIYFGDIVILTILIQAMHKFYGICFQFVWAYKKYQNAEIDTNKALKIINSRKKKILYYQYSLEGVSKITIYNPKYLIKTKIGSEHLIEFDSRVSLDDKKIIIDLDKGIEGFILISGQEGCGKTTLMNLLSATSSYNLENMKVYIDSVVGVTYNYELPNGMHSIKDSIYYLGQDSSRDICMSDTWRQALTEDLISVHDISDDSLEEYLKIGGLYEYLDERWKDYLEETNKKDKDKDKDLEEEDINVYKGWFDIKVNLSRELDEIKKTNKDKIGCKFDLKLNNLSGGYKSKLLLTKAYIEATNSKCKILMLDEPEQGLSESSAISVLTNIREHWKGVIFMIAHNSKVKESISVIQEIVFEKNYKFSVKYF